MTRLDVLVGLVFAVVVRAVFHAQIELGASLGFDQPSRILCFILLALTSPFGMLIHEFGHYAAGAALTVLPALRGWPGRVRSQRGPVDSTPDFLTPRRCGRPCAIHICPVQTAAGHLCGRRPAGVTRYAADLRVSVAPRRKRISLLGLEL
jgi:hypothetical protein